MVAVAGGSKISRRLSPPTPRVAFDGARPVRIALINNMSDGAVIRTEHQFTNLLQEAANGKPVQVVRYSLPAIPRSEKIQDHIETSYEPIDALWHHVPDAVVVTGAEPREPHLKDEPYWSSLARLIDWIDDQGIPAMFSCLAAHAAVSWTDGISRAALDDKCFGVFEHEVAADHPLMDGTGPRMWLPHTRWNQMTEAELTKAGYQILSRSKDAGVGFFAKERRSLWLFCQGHPEYDGPDLLREYRRDVSRFLSGERASYPELPRSYFGEAETQLLGAFKQQALARGDASVMDAFPRIRHDARTWNTWRPAAISVFGNWLRYVAGTKTLPDVARMGYRQSQAVASMPNSIGDHP